MKRPDIESILINRMTFEEIRLCQYALELERQIKELKETTCRDCGAVTKPGTGNARCQSCWDDRMGADAYSDYHEGSESEEPK